MNTLSKMKTKRERRSSQDMLETIRVNGPLTRDELVVYEDAIKYSSIGTRLTRLMNEGYVERERIGRFFQYQVSEKGKTEDIDQQRRIKSIESMPEFCYLILNKRANQTLNVIEAEDFTYLLKTCKFCFVNRFVEVDTYNPSKAVIFDGSEEFVEKYNDSMRKIAIKLHFNEGAKN